MDLTTAITLVTDDTREQQDEPDMSARAAVELSRTDLDLDDIDAVYDDPTDEMAIAYRMVLDAGDEDITRALR